MIIEIAPWLLVPLAICIGLIFFGALASWRDEDKELTFLKLEAAIALIFLVGVLVGHYNV